jgi:hypothetical protein
MIFISALNYSWHRKDAASHSMDPCMIFIHDFFDASLVVHFREIVPHMNPR